MTPVWVHSSVWVESATTVAELSSLPVRRLAHTSIGITTSDTTAKTSSFPEPVRVNVIAHVPPVVLQGAVIRRLGAAANAVR